MRPGTHEIKRATTTTGLSCGLTLPTPFNTIAHSHKKKNVAHEALGKSLVYTSLLFVCHSITQKLSKRFQ